MRLPRGVPRAMRHLRRALVRTDELERLYRLLEAAGRIEGRQLDQIGSKRLADREFTVYSQSGEDGILHFLVRAVTAPQCVFVEFGVGDYREANTRFLALNDGWSGLVMDSSADNVRAIRDDPAYWRMNVTATQAFVTRENVNTLIAGQDITGEIGLLSIDIDGNDYWVLEAIDVISPAILVIEYNSRFGPDRAVTIPYDPAFDRFRAHYSGLYAGASLKAIYRLARRKGYSFVGCNSFGVNAFFVRDDLVSDNVRIVDVEEGFVAGQFRESRTADGQLAYLSRPEEEEILARLPVVEIDA